MGEMWEGTRAGVFAVEVLQALELGTQPDLMKFREIVLGLSDGIYTTLTEILLRSPADRCYRRGRLLGGPKTWY